MNELIPFVKRLTKSAYTGWCHFFFEANSIHSLRLFRVLLGLLLFFAYVVRAVDNDFYYGANGVIDLQKMIETFPMKYRWSLLIWFPGKAMLWGSTIAFLVSLLTMAFGFFPRISAAIAMFFHISFMHRNMGIVYGLDMIAVFFLFYLSFAKTDSAPRNPDSWSSLLTSVSLRLIQIQVCIIYAYSGWEKLKGVTWWKGEAIWTVFANAQIARWHMNWVSHFPLVISIATYATLIFEIYFPALIWSRKLRLWVLLVGVGLHLGIGIVVFIPFFAALMVVSYASFLTDDEAAFILRRIKAWLPRPPFRFKAV
jgi:hypothetical protein